jgi:hypothetical protein
LIEIAESKEMTFAPPDAGHAFLPGHLLDGFQVAPQMNRGLFRCEQRLEMLSVVRFYEVLLHMYCLQVQTYRSVVMNQSIRGLCA